MTRLDWEQYYLLLARAVSLKSSCRKYKVGCILVHEDNYVLGTAYNGTPSGYRNCDQGGCPHCASDEPSHPARDTCLCVHAEANIVAFATRRGGGLERSYLYTTTRPCITCLKLLHQAGVEYITYIHAVPYDEEGERIYKQFASMLGVSIRQGDTVDWEYIDA